MTAQIGDIYTYNGDHYSIVAISPRIDFHPSQYGLNPMGICTACWNGYWCEYNITEDGIFLEDLYVYDAGGNYPKINGRKPSKEERMSHKHYKKLHIPMKYTGKILVGDDFLQEYYIHMGYQRFFAYKKLTEFVFKDGKLVETNDYSEVAQIMREILEMDDETIKEITKNPKKYIDEKTREKYKGKIWWT